MKTESKSKINVVSEPLVHELPEEILELMEACGCGCGMLVGQGGGL